MKEKYFLQNKSIYDMLLHSHWLRRKKIQHDWINKKKGIANMPKVPFYKRNHISTIVSRICLRSMTVYCCWLLINLISMKKPSTRNFISKSTVCSFMYFLVAMLEYDCFFCYIFILIFSASIFINM